MQFLRLIRHVCSRERRSDAGQLYQSDTVRCLSSTATSTVSPMNHRPSLTVRDRIPFPVLLPADIFPRKHCCQCPLGKTRTRQGGLRNQRHNATGLVSGDNTAGQVATNPVFCLLALLWCPFGNSEDSQSDQLVTLSQVFHKILHLVAGGCGIFSRKHCINAL